MISGSNILRWQLRDFYFCFKCIFSWLSAPQNPLLTRSASWSSSGRVGRVTNGAASASASQGWSWRSPRSAVSARAAGDGPTCQILARTIYRNWSEFAFPLDQQSDTRQRLGQSQLIKTCLQLLPIESKQLWNHLCFKVKVFCCFSTSITCETILLSFKTHHNLLRPIKSEQTQPMFRHKLVTHWSLTASLGVFSNNPVWGSGRGLQNCYKRIKENN